MMGIRKSVHEVPGDAKESGDFSPWSRSALLDPEDEETGWKRRWYFFAQLTEALSAAREDGREVTLIHFRLPLSAWTPTNRLRIYLTLRLQILQREVGPAVATFGRLSEDEFAVCVESTEEFGASTAAMLIQHTLRGLSAETGIAVFPRDGEDRESLLNAARRTLEDRPSNVIDLDAYRRLRRPRAA